MAKVILKAAMALIVGSANLEFVEFKVAHKHFELRCRATIERVACRINIPKQDGQF
jgi:hypothetical protein